jgi:hypothetical protein
MPTRKTFLLFGRIFIELNEEAGAFDPFGLGSKQAFVDHDPL